VVEDAADEPLDALLEACSQEGARCLTAWQQDTVDAASQLIVAISCDPVVYAAAEQLCQAVIA
jgi:hypothetical protein